MRKRNRALLSFFLTLFLISIVTNLSFIPYTDAYCHTQYESFVTYAFPCGFPSLFCLYAGSVKTVTLSSATLHAGNTATPSSLATSSLQIDFNSPNCTPTFVQSLTLTGSGISSINNWDNDTRPSSIANLIVFTSAHTSNLIPAANVTSLTFYPAVMAESSQSIVVGNVYNYVANFANGQAVSGSLIAQ